MKTFNLVTKMGLAALVAGSMGTAYADTVPGTASATVIAPLTVAETTALAYGNVASGTAAGTVVVTSGGAVSATGGATFVPGSGATQATFDITGAATTAILVTLTTAGAQIDDAGAGAAMALSAFTNTALPVITDGGGLATFDVGATLNVGIGQTTGLYNTTLGTGSPYSVTVNYN